MFVHDIGNKVVWRIDKSEKVGVTVTDIHGSMRILEYSEIPVEYAEAMNEGSQKLLYGAANICNHYMSVSFLQSKVINSLTDTYHIAKKKIPYYDPLSNTKYTPTTNNGMKLELFIFDVFPLAKKWVVMEVNRYDEFAPVKNEPGNSSDSPDTARVLLSDLSKQWLKDAGAILDNDSKELQCEISPLVSINGEDLHRFNGQVVTLPVYIE